MTTMVIIAADETMLHIHNQPMIRALESIIITAAKGAELDPSIKRKMQPDF